MRAPIAAASTANGEATSARSPRLNRHLPPNARRRSAARSAWTPAHPRASACNAGRGRQFSAVNREAQSVAGHRIDEAGRVAREQQAVDRGIPDVDGERSKHDGRTDEPGVGGAIAQQRIVGERAGQQRPGSPSAASPAKDGFTRHTLVSPPCTGAMPM